jgi:hypothetical protein
MRHDDDDGAEVGIIKGNNTGFSLIQRILVAIALVTAVLLYLNEAHSRQLAARDFALSMELLNTQISALHQNHKQDLKKLKDSMPQIECPVCAPCKTGGSVVAASAKELKRAHLMESKSRRLEEALQLSARETLSLKYGPDPHYVDLDIQLPPEVSDGEKRTIRLEMAPAALMPVAVLHFLNQVAAGAWNGCSFHRNAGHVLQATSMGKQCKHSRFLDPSRGVFPSVPFQEYSPQFPHDKYTVGLAGRPGGPDLYINLQNNTLDHGPGGQSSCKFSAVFAAS